MLAGFFIAPMLISNNILESFQKVNRGIEISSGSFNEKNDSLYNVIESKKLWEQAQYQSRTLKDASDSIVEHIEGLKKELFLLGDNEDYESSTEFMINRGKASDLKDRIKGYEKTILELTKDSISGSYIFLKDSIDGEVWEKAFFYRLPLAVSVTNLSKIISDIRINESLCVKQLLNSAEKEEEILIRAKPQ